MKNIIISLLIVLVYSNFSFAMTDVIGVNLHAECTKISSKEDRNIPGFPQKFTMIRGYGKWASNILYFVLFVEDEEKYFFYDRVKRHSYTTLFSKENQWIVKKNDQKVYDVEELVLYDEDTKELNLTSTQIRMNFFDNKLRSAKYTCEEFDVDEETTLYHLRY